MNINKNLVSIIMASYNAEKYIEEAIDSVLSQTYSNWELFVIDDFSNDNSVKIIKKFSDKDSRIKLIASEINQGPGATRNLGLNQAKGRFIAFLDSDDIWISKKLETQILFMLKGLIPISYTSYSIIDSLSKDTGRSVIVNNQKLLYTDYLKNTIIGFSTSVIDTKYFNYNFKLVTLSSREDTFLWINLLKDKNIFALGLNEKLVKYRVHKSSITSNKIHSAYLVWRLYRDYVNLNIFKTFYYFSFYLFNTLKKRI